MAATSNDQLLICTACGTQFDETDRLKLISCHICDDPRQYVPRDGQAFTTLAALKASNYSNKRVTFAFDDRLIEIRTEPQVAIGQRAILVQTPNGNVLWDCITLLDDETIEWINSIGGLAGIVISHPHYYATHHLWARTFKCPVYLSWEDREWLVNPLHSDSNDDPARVMIHDTEVDIFNPKTREPTGVKAIKLGGHFPGSLVGLFDGRLFLADTLVTTPSGMGDWKKTGRPKGMNSFAFMWSIPNMIPLPPDEVASMWEILKKYEFRSTHGAFKAMDIVAKDVKARVLESMKIQVRAEGYNNHALLLQQL